MTTRQVRQRRITRGAMLVTCGLLFLGGLPASADDIPGTDENLSAPPDGIIFGSFPPEQIETALEVTGWPTSNILAGETVTLSVHVDPVALGTPSLEGALVGIGAGGEILTYGELDETNTATLQVRPLMPGPIELTPLFVGDMDGVFAPAAADSGTITVDPVPVTMTAWFSDEQDDEVAAGGGATLEANALVTPFCVDDADEAATAECYATYGVPAGTVVVMSEGDTMAEISVPGTQPDAAFAMPGADLSGGTEAEFALLPVQLPNMTQGATESFEMNVAFAPTNWFMSAVAEPVTVNMNAARLDLSLFVGEDWSDSTTHNVNDSSVTLTAYFLHSLDPVAPASGTITFYVDGVAVSDAMPIDDENLVEYVWDVRESGTYEVAAAFTPDTLNHVGSMSEVHTITIIIPPVPNPFPNEDPAGSDSADGQTPRDQAPGPKALPATGADGSGPSPWHTLGGSMMLMAAPLILHSRRRTSS